MNVREFRDPLKDLNSTYRSKKEDIDWSKFHYTFNAYQIKLKHLFMIFERYKLREKSYEKYLQQCQEMINARKENRPYVPDGKKTQESKRIRMDRDGSFSVKHGQVHYGYKSHIKIDIDHHLIREIEVTTASVHDSDIDLSKKDEVYIVIKGTLGKRQRQREMVV